MITYCVDRDSIALILNRNEVPFAPQVIKDCLKSRGLACWEHIEGELFELEDQLLLIARPLSPLCLSSPCPRFRLRRR